MSGKLNRKDLGALRRVDLDAVDRARLVDLREVDIDPALPIEQRAAAYLERIKNPYAFRSGDVPVRLRFADPDRSVDDAVRRYLQALKNR